MQRIIAPEFLSEVYFLMYSKKAWRPILSSTHVRPPNTISYLTPCVTLWLLSRFNCSIMKNIFPCQCWQALPADVPFSLLCIFFFFTACLMFWRPTETNTPALPHVSSQAANICHLAVSVLITTDPFRNFDSEEEEANALRGSWASLSVVMWSSSWWYKGQRSSLRWDYHQ